LWLRLGVRCEAWFWGMTASGIPSVGWWGFLALSSNHARQPDQVSVAGCWIVQAQTISGPIRQGSHIVAPKGTLQQHKSGRSSGIATRTAERRLRGWRGLALTSTRSWGSHGELDWRGTSRRRELGGRTSPPTPALDSRPRGRCVVALLTGIPSDKWFIVHSPTFRSNANSVEIKKA